MKLKSKRQLEEDDCGDGQRAPCAKKPRLADEIANGLTIKPPPVVGVQSEPSFETFNVFLPIV